jgi:hypothetical protein
MRKLVAAAAANNSVRAQTANVLQLCQLPLRLSLLLMLLQQLQHLGWHRHRHRHREQSVMPLPHHQQLHLCNRHLCLCLRLWLPNCLALFLFAATQSVVLMLATTCAVYACSLCAQCTWVCAGRGGSRTDQGVCAMNITLLGFVLAQAALAQTKPVPVAAQQLVQHQHTIPVQASEEPLHLLHMKPLEILAVKLSLVS